MEYCANVSKITITGGTHTAPTAVGTDLGETWVCFNYQRPDT